MIFRHGFRPFRLILSWATAVIALAALYPLHGQAPDPERGADQVSPADPVAESSGPRELSIHLDLETLLVSDQVICDQIDDGLWQIRPSVPQRTIQTRQPRSQENRQRNTASRQRPMSQANQKGGRRPLDKHLLLLPLMIKPGTETVTLDSRAIRVRGGSFVAWRIGDQTTVAARGGQQGANPTVKTVAAPIPPRFARRLIVEPDGHLKWSLERSIRGGSLQNNLFGFDLKIDSKRIVTKRLGAGDPPQRPIGKTSRETMAQFRKELGEYNRRVGKLKNEKAAELKQFSKLLDKLPIRFEAAMPNLVWAVFDMKANLRELAIDSKSMPRWRVTYDHLQSLREIASGNTRLARSDDRETPAEVMLAVTRRADPYSQRLAAHALSRSDLINQLAEEDELVELATRIINSTDSQASRAMIDGILSTDQNSTTDRLIALALPKMDAEHKLQWLRATLERKESPRQGQPAARRRRTTAAARTATVEPTAAPLAEFEQFRTAPLVVGPDAGAVPVATEQSTSSSPVQRKTDELDAADRTPPSPPSEMSRDQFVLQVTNLLLQDDEGPAPAAILEALVRDVESLGGGISAENRRALYTGGMDFGALEDGRLEPAVRFVVEQAPKSVLAGRWLGNRLLWSSMEQQVRSRTLLVLGEPPSPRTVEVMGGTTDPTSANAPIGRPFPSMREGTLINIESIEHGLFDALQDPDKQLRTSAWAALPRFIIGAPAARPGGRNTPDAKSSIEPLSHLLALAREQGRAGPQFVAFLDHQPEQQRSTLALVHLAAATDSESAAPAVNALLGSERPLVEAMKHDSLSEPEIHRFVDQVYRLATGQTTLVAGLIRVPNRRSNLAEWLGKQIAVGKVPAAGGWAEAFGNQREVLVLLTDDDEVVALAAAAALITGAGGSEQDAQGLVVKIQELEDPSPVNVEAKWDTTKKRIHADRVVRTAGAFHLKLSIEPADTETGAEDIRKSEKGLGIVQLSVEDDTVYLGNKVVTGSVSNERLAIRIDEPQSLKNLADDLAHLSLEQIRAFELLPDEDGGWRAKFETDDGRNAELVLEPVNQ